MNRVLPPWCVLTLLVFPSTMFAQRIDLGLTGFEAMLSSSVHVSGGWLVVMTGSPVLGGAGRCVEVPPSLNAFGGTGFVPSRLPNGQPNRGSGVIGLTLFDAPACGGTSLGSFQAGPSLNDSTPRDVEIPITFNGRVPAEARSGRFFIHIATSSANEFQLCFRDPWLQAETGAPDLAPQIDLWSADLGLRDPGGLREEFIIDRRQPLWSGSTLKRGKFAVVTVTVKNHGTATATGWRAVVVPPNGWKKALFYFADCSDFAGSGLVTHEGQPLGAGQSRTLCVAFTPGEGAASVQPWVQTYATNDSNPGNDRAVGPTLTVEPPRDTAPLPDLLLPRSGGRGR
jgi:hypothetical protein